MFMVWVCALYWCIGGVFAMIPTFTDKSFGSEYFGTIYGLVFTAVIFSSLCSAFFVTTMVKRIGVLGITIALACLVFVAILVTCIPKDWSYLDVKEQTEEKETV